MGSERRLRLFIYARLIVSFLFLGFTLLLGFKYNTVSIDSHQPGVIKLMAFSFLFSITSLYFLEKRKYTQFLTSLQVIWDLLFVTILVLFTGGILSPFSFLYLLSIMTAGMLLGRRQSLYTASLCGILYGTILDFQYFGYLSRIGLTQEDAYQIGALRLFYTISLNLIAFGLTAFITGLLAERARVSEEALHRSTIDYSELAQLNSAIVAHSESGLLTVTESGRIRVFNPYAEEITGLSQSEVYDMPIEAVFPQISVHIAPEYETVDHEFEYFGDSGYIATLEYRVSSFSDSFGALKGYIVNFKDITKIRSMEIALKKADRLAALGELSARMAHEIRNPLAALCGSVQLLSNSLDGRGNDARLLAIILRESERLNSLISEFLIYARPIVPKLQDICLYSYINDELHFLKHDPKYARIEFEVSVPQDITVFIDPDQIHQVILNLIQNSADAMPDGGKISIECGFSDLGVYLAIVDNGIGVTEESMKHIFEPFWTTKAAGTGLGLAISYRIIESHNGDLSVENVSGGGSRFIITFPIAR